MIYNEDVNAARLALQKAVEDFHEWSDNFSPDQLRDLFMVVLELEGLGKPFQHDPYLYDSVRARLDVVDITTKAYRLKFQRGEADGRHNHPPAEVTEAYLAGYERGKDHSPR